MFLADGGSLRALRKYDTQKGMFLTLNRLLKGNEELLNKACLIPFVLDTLSR